MCPDNFLLLLASHTYTFQWVWVIPPSSLVFHLCTPPWLLFDQLLLTAWSGLTLIKNNYHFKFCLCKISHSSFFFVQNQTLTKWLSFQPCEGHCMPPTRKFYPWVLVTDQIISIPLISVFMASTSRARSLISYQEIATFSWLIPLVVENCTLHHSIH